MRGGHEGPVCVVAAVVLFIVGQFIYNHVRERQAHDGVSKSKRRRVHRSGTAANATVLSSLRLEQTTGNWSSFRTFGSSSSDSRYYSIVYEVVGPGGETFRAKGVEEMPRGFMSANAAYEFELQVGETVAVKYDPVDHTMVLVDPYQKFREAERLEAEAERGKENARQAKERAKKEDEARLLRGDPPR
jgi:hypothetical protein